MTTFVTDISCRQARQQLRRDVSLMRKLGVAKWKDIVIGDEPRRAAPPPRTAEESAERAAKAERERLKTMFAASGTIPASLVEVSPDADTPRAVVQRRNGAGKAAHGTRTSRQS